jgi:hypothetical protein
LFNLILLQESFRAKNSKEIAKRKVKENVCEFLDCFVNRPSAVNGKDFVEVTASGTTDLFVKIDWILNILLIYIRTKLRIIEMQSFKNRIIYFFKEGKSEDFFNLENFTSEFRDFFYTEK